LRLQPSKKKVKVLARWEGVKRLSRSKPERIKLKMGFPQAGVEEAKKSVVGPK
jgi:hypothetical protein